MESKFWSFAGIALAVMAFFYRQVDTHILLLIGAVTIIICFVLSYLWNKILNSHHKLVDWACFLFSKNKHSYTVVDKIVRYKIKNSTEAEYNLQCKLKIKKIHQEFCYKGRYHWDQDGDIDVSVSCDGEYRFETSEDLKWSNVNIFPVNRIMHKNDPLNCGFTLRNLHINRLNKHSYLSCKMIEKVKHLNLIAEVDSSLKPMDKAMFVVQDNLGEEISREEISYNPATSSYAKMVSYPRKGRKYVIKWEYRK